MAFEGSRAYYWTQSSACLPKVPSNIHCIPFVHCGLKPGRPFLPLPQSLTLALLDEQQQYHHPHAPLNFFLNNHNVWCSSHLLQSRRINLNNLSSLVRLPISPYCSCHCSRRKPHRRRNCAASSDREDTSDVRLRATIQNTNFHRERIIASYTLTSWGSPKTT